MKSLSRLRVISIGALVLLLIGLAAAQQKNRQNKPSTVTTAGATAQTKKNGQQQREQKQNKQSGQAASTLQLPDAVKALQALSTILGRPTDHSMTISVWSATERQAYIEYGNVSGQYSSRSDVVTLPAGSPVEVLLAGLSANTGYFYRLRYQSLGDASFATSAQQAFHTQRAAGSKFVFELQGDSHPERRQQFDAGLYAQTLTAVAADHPDFYITMGDDFSVDTLHDVNQQSVAERYELQRPFLSLVAQSVPLFLVNGNHEQAAAANLDGGPDNVAVWAQTARNRLYPMPAPDGFYTGNAVPVAHIGLLRNYYAWSWGDALFVVIDPYWHSKGVVDNAFGRDDDARKNRNLWDITLGDAQYQWLRNTLSQSKARFKFVFAHHVLGTGRGGVELAGTYEWGGKNKQGRDEFKVQRPGWELPIHQLMVKYGVSIFFQGHDHVFARQELDGVVYQTLPEPADPNYALYFADAYKTGDVLPNSGRVRVQVGPDAAQVQYIRSRLPADVSADQPDGEVAYSYVVKPR